MNDISLTQHWQGARVYPDSHPLIQRARAVRRHKRISIDALAERTGYNRSTISSWECGRAAPSIAALTDYLTALGLDLSIEPHPKDRRT